MKNMKFLCLVFLLIGFKSLNYSRTINCVNPNKVTLCFNQNENMVQAYVQNRGQWVQGYVFISSGYVTRVQFPDLVDGGRVISRAQLYQKLLPINLSPNSPLAINNNFTSYIDIPNYGRAYFSY